MRNVINWDEYFMGIALMCSKRSKDDRTQVGVCIINDDKRIVAAGYNGMPNGTNDEEILGYVLKTI